MSDVVTGGGGLDLGNIFQTAIGKGLEGLLGNLFGGGDSGDGPFSEALGGLIQAGPAAYFDNELVERATETIYVTHSTTLLFLRVSRLLSL